MKLRRWFLIAAIFLMVGGVFWWRRAPRVLGDEQTINAQIDEMRAAAERKDASGLTRFLADDFRMQHQSKRDLGSGMAGQFLVIDAVQVELGDVRTNVKGESARTEGGFRVGTRNEASAPFETHGGRFALTWRKIKGEWKIEAVEGAENLLQ